MYYASYDRRDPVSIPTAFGASIATGAIATIVSHPFDFLKTKIQVYNEGIGLTGKGYNLGYNMYTVYENF